MRTFTVLDMPQRSPEWYLARAGRVTSSVAAAMLSKGRKKGEESVGRRNLRVQLALERITGAPFEDDYQSHDMKRGAEMEPTAVRAYEASTGALVRRSGFVQHATLQAGASLDGHVGDFVGIVEFKCPKPATHLEYLRGGGLPSEYVAQVTHAMWLTGAEWVDFCSFHDRFIGKAQLFRVRMMRDQFDFASYEAALQTFLSEVDREVEEIVALSAGVSQWQRAADAAVA